MSKEEREALSQQQTSVEVPRNVVNTRHASSTNERRDPPRAPPLVASYMSTTRECDIVLEKSPTGRMMNPMPMEITHKQIQGYELTMGEYYDVLDDTNTWAEAEVCL